MGRIVHTPKFKTLDNGKKLIKFSIAVNRSLSLQKQQNETDFFNCTAWDKTAEFINNYFSKGDAIIIEGTIQMKKYQDKYGNNRISYEIMVKQVNFCAYAKKENIKGVDKNIDINNDLPF